jgi:transcriptional regulator with GAF, ATPase, and Fis domain
MFKAEIPELEDKPSRSTRRKEKTDYLRSVLLATKWRIRGKGGAAEILGLKPTTLEARMKKLGISRRE